ESAPWKTLIPGFTALQQNTANLETHNRYLHQAIALGQENNQERLHGMKTIRETMAQVAAIADKTSSEASNVATTFKDLLAVAQSLQDTVRQFKVE
ncbi:MAG: hypothetical protein ACK58N_11335, partial [Synechocystis sp.]